MLHVNNFRNFVDHSERVIVANEINYYKAEMEQKKDNPILFT